MSARSLMRAMLVGCFCMGVAFAAPEPTPKETKGKIVGLITQKDGGKITVKGEEGSLSLMPYWRGGMPSAGGGFDKEMLKQLEKFKIGDTVKIAWVFEEHYRIDKIQRVEKAKPIQERAPEAKAD